VNLALLLSVFVIATCGLVYELIAGALASYLLGDSVTQFSTIIGTYLFAMGIGSWLSRYIEKNLIAAFIRVELLVGLVGGSSAAILFLAFEQVTGFRILLYALVSLTGVLVGLEIPLLMRLLKEREEFRDFKDLVSQVFTFDYIGALLASLIFPLLLVPHLGLMRSAFLFGIINTLVALATIQLFQKHEPTASRLRIPAVLTTLFLGIGFASSEKLTSWAEGQAMPGRILLAKSTAYQRIVLTQEANDFRLFLNGNLQFSSIDEHRYHESLVHPAMGAAASRANVLILGGGDGLAAREVLKHPEVERITLVDLDPDMTSLFKKHEGLRGLNQDSLNHPKLKLINEDAFLWLKASRDLFDVIIIDFPDPSNFSLGKLYTLGFYETLRERLSPSGAAVIQSASPWMSRRAFWCIDETLRSAGLRTAPYHAHVPSFGEWGFILVSKAELDIKKISIPGGLKFLNDRVLLSLFSFPPDIDKLPTEVNRLNNQMLVRYFEEDWAQHVQ